jgi:hypothetical protein
MNAYLYQPGNDGEFNATDKLSLNGNDMFLRVGKRDYRFQFDSSGILELVLINGKECKISSWRGYPSVILTAPESEHDVLNHSIEE